MSEATRERVRSLGWNVPMADEERERLYDWLAVGKMDDWLRRMVCERITELEDQVAALEAER